MKRSSQNKHRFLRRVAAGNILRWTVAISFAVAVASSQASGQQASADISVGPPRRQAERNVAPMTTLQKLVNEAQQNNPQVLAARRAWQAAAQAPSQVSTLPDPEVMVEHMTAGTPLPFWDYKKVEMTFIGLGVSQSIPYPGKLRLRGEIARRQADSAGDRLESMRRSIVEQVKTTYYSLASIQKTLEILERDRALIDQMEKIADARYRVGKGSQQDVLKAQLERTKLLRDTAETRQQQGSLQAQIKTLLNRPPESEDITVESLTETPLPFSSEQLLSLVRNGNPEVSEQQKVVKGKSLGVELAKKDFLPDFNVKYAWQHTPASFPDRYSVSLGVSIPIHRARRQNPELAQASEELNQSRREYEAQVQQTYFEVKDQYLAADTGAKVLKMYREGLIPQATATFQAGLAAYQSGNEDFQSLLASFLDVLNFDKEYWRTLADHETALARLERLTGVSLP